MLDSVERETLVQKTATRRDAQSPEVNKLLKEYDEWFEEAKTHKASQTERWKRNLLQYHNKISLDIPIGGTEIRINLFLSDIETQMSYMRKGLPTFDIEPEDKNDVFFADRINLRAKQVVKKSKLKYHSLGCIKDSMILSNGLISVFPDLDDSDKLTKKGLRIECVDLSTWFPSPDATDMDIRYHASYHIFAVPKDYKYVSQNYEDKDGKPIEIAPDGYTDENNIFHIIDEAKSDTTEKDKADKVLIKECYTMDEDDKKYPNGKAMVWANGVLLDDKALGPEKKVDHSCMHYFMIKNYGTAHRIYGIGEPELINSLVKTINEILSALADNIRYTGNPIFKIASSLINKLGKKIRREPGEYIEVTKMTDIEWMIPPGSPSYIFQLLEILFLCNDTVTGVRDILRGQKPAGITAASALAILQEVALTRVHYKLETGIAEFFENIGIFIVYILQTYDKEMQNLKKRNAEGEFEFVEYNPKARYKNTYGLDAEKLPDNANSEEGISLKDSKFEVEVVPGPRIPEGSVVEEEMAKEKLEKGIYTFPDYVARSNEKDKRELIENHEQAEGILQFKERIIELGEATDEFNRLIVEVLGLINKEKREELDEKEQWVLATKEQKLAEMLQNYPEFLKTLEYDLLPTELKERLVNVFVQPAEEEAINEEVPV